MAGKIAPTYDQTPRQIIASRQALSHYVFEIGLDGVEKLLSFS